MIITILALLLLVTAFIAGLAMTKPGEFEIVRSLAMDAPPAKVFPEVNDLHRWDAWSPWAKLDPNATNSFEGPSAGKDAAMSWSGNRKVGQGKMTIIESQPVELVRFRLEFLKPMKATNIAEFRFRPEGDRTNVTWSMSGKNNFFGKVFGLFVDCDKMVGASFEKGLASLRAIVEGQR